MFGFLNVYKPKGITSHDVISRLRRVFKIKQIGHAGTLDPFAQGVLPVAVGKATRLLEYLSDDKGYVATIKFGQTTDTYDVEGEVVSTSDIKVTQEMVEEILSDFQGEIEQIPPIYSAIKVDGKKLYEYARAGQEVEVKSRKVMVYEISLVSFDYDNQVAEIYCKCSKGTYIRTIGYDIGQKLGCGAYLIELKRVLSANFGIDDAILLDDITQDTPLVSPKNVLPIKQLELNDIEFERVSHGMTIYNNGRFSEGEVVGLLYKGDFVGVAQVVETKLKIKKFVG